MGKQRCPNSKTDSWTRSLGVEGSLWTVSSFRCSRTGKEIFPGPIKVISYSQAVVRLSRVSGGVKAAVCLSAEEKWFRSRVPTQRERDVREVWGPSGGCLGAELVDKQSQKMLKRFKGRVSRPRLFNLELMLSWVIKTSQTSECRLKGRDFAVGGADFARVQSHNAPLCLDGSGSHGPIHVRIPRRHPVHHQICPRAAEMGWAEVGLCIFLFFFFFPFEEKDLGCSGLFDDFVVKCTLNNTT